MKTNFDFELEKHGLESEFKRLAKLFAKGRITSLHCFYGVIDRHRDLDQAQIETARNDAGRVVIMNDVG